MEPNNNIRENKRYKVNLYYGGERPDSICWVNHLADARQLAMHSEHYEIIDTHNNNTLIQDE